MCAFVLLGAIAATVFIAFILALYAVLWKCMVSPPQRYTTDTSRSTFHVSSYWHSDLVFTCLLGSHAWTLNVNLTSHDFPPTYIILCCCGCHVSTPVCFTFRKHSRVRVRIQQRHAAWRRTSRFRLFSRSFGILRVWTATPRSFLQRYYLLVTSGASKLQIMWNTCLSGQSALPCFVAVFSMNSALLRESADQ